MSDISAAIAEKNNLTKDTIDWVVPHQANLRIIDAVAHRLEAVSYTHLKENISCFRIELSDGRNSVGSMRPLSG